MTSGKKQPIVLFDIDDVMFDTNHFISSNLSEFKLYDDVIDVLARVSTKAQIGILSQGEKEFQLKKIIETGIHDSFVFEHIHIVEKKDESMLHVLEKYKGSKIFFIDDRIAGLFHAKKILPELITIWHKRGRYSKTDQAIDGFTPDHVVENLGDVVELI